MGIFYSDSQTAGAPPDSDAIYVRGGFRGEVVENLSANVLVGWTEIESDDFEVFLPANGPDGKEHSTADVSAQVRYEATELISFTGGYTRLITFAPIPNDPWQVINRFLFRGNFLANEQIDLFGRFQFDHASSAQGIMRDYWSLSGGGTYTVTPQAVIDASITFRSGETEGQVVQSADYDGFIFSVGAAFTY